MAPEITAQEIIEYLQEHPHSGDTAEGIVKWWVLRHRLNQAADSAHHLLAQLVEMGVLYERRTADGQVIYFAKD